MKRKTLLTLLAAVVLMMPALAGCKKKPKPTPAAPEPAMEAPAPREVTAPPTPSTTGDMQEDPLSGDLEAVNDYVMSQGLIGDVYFDFDRYELKPEARERLTKNGEFMKAHPEFSFTIEGHCDERGTNEYNLALGDRRASAAQSYLGSLGVAGSQARIVTYGEERPVCSERDENCWWRNRRAHFVITARQ